MTLRGSIYAPPDKKPAPLRRVNLNLEKLRVLWRLICDRHWISQQQLLFVSQKLEDIGRMVGGWLKDADGARAEAGRDVRGTPPTGHDPRRVFSPASPGRGRAG